MGVHLVLLNGPQPGAAVSLDAGHEPMTIGRDVSRDVPIDDHQASRLHARVWHDGGEWRIEDCGSRNGTLVNGVRIERAVIRPGDLIRIGDRQLVLSADLSDAEAPVLSASLAAASTVVERIEAPDSRATFLERLHVESQSRPMRSLSLLLRLSAALPEQGDVRDLVKVARDTIVEAINAGRAAVLLAGPDGRLRDCLTDDEGQQDHLLGSMAMQNNEAILSELESTGETSAGRGSALGAPLYSSHAQRGAIECFEPGEPEGFDRTDLEFVIAVSHQLGMALENLEHREQLEQSNERLRKQLSEQHRIAGDSRATRELVDQIGRVAPTNSTVLILGESGVGKELVARTIHENGARSAGPFVAVNCASFNESLLESELFGHEAGAFTGADRRRPGQFEQAHRGTIFLDEIGEMSPNCQAKLLRVLEGHPFERLGGHEPIQVEVRVLAATHRDLRELVEKDRFREDLYYRLRVIELPVPPLRERDDDARRLAVLFLDQFRRQMGRRPRRFSPAALQAIRAYGWPGNIRELKNAVERAVVMGQEEEISVEDLGVGPALSEEDRLLSLDELEQRHIERVLHAVGGNKTQACKILGIGRGTLYKKLHRTAY